MEKKAFVKKVFGILPQNFCITNQRLVLWNCYVENAYSERRLTDEMYEAGQNICYLQFHFQ